MLELSLDEIRRQSLPKSFARQPGRGYKGYEGIFFLYFLLDDGEIVYVGLSTRPMERLHCHRYEKDWERYYITKATGTVIEREMIQRFQPKYNIHHNRGVHKTGHPLNPLDTATQIV